MADNLPREDTRTVNGKGFLRGMISSLTSREIDENTAAYLQNVRWKKGKWVRDTGGAFLLDEAEDEVVFDGEIQAIVEHRMQNGVIEVLVITTASAYRKNGDDWDQLDDDSAAPLALGGDEDKRVTGVSLPFTDFFVFTNQVDEVLYFDPADNEVKLLEDLVGSNLPAGTKAGAVASYDSSLVLVATEEGGSPFPQRVRVCDKGDLTEWSAGVAYTADLLELPDPIVAAELLGPYLILYRTRTIARMEIAGVEGKRFIIDNMVPNMPVLSANCCVRVMDVHYVFGANDLFTYSGGFNVTPVGAEIKEEMFEEVEPSLLSQCYTYYDVRFKEVWFLYPTQDISFDPGIEDDEIVTTFKCRRLHIDSATWAVRFFDNLAVKAIGRSAASTEQSVTWENAVGKWSQQTLAWNDVILNEGAPLVYLGVKDAADGFSKLIGYDYIDSADAGNAVVPLAISKTFEEPMFDCFLNFVEYEYSGGAHYFSVILPNGQELQRLVDPDTEEFTLPLIKISVGVTAQSWQLKWLGTEGNGFSLGRYGAEYRLETES